MTNAATTTEAQAATAAPQGAQGAPEKAAATKKASPKKKAARAPKGAKEAKPKKEATGAREGSKKAQVLELIRRPNGATIQEIMKVTAWQAHSVRGFVSGALGKEMGLKVESFKRENSDRAYRLAQ